MVSVTEHITGRTADGQAVEIEVDSGLVVGLRELRSAASGVLMPGLIDLQLNGYQGHDLNEEQLSVDRLRALTQALASQGTTSYLPTLITGTPQRVDQALKAIAKACGQDSEVANAVVGVHLEGPYLSPAPGCRGAHPPELMRDPDVADLDRWQEASGGRIRIVTLAPERPGSTEFIAAATAAGIVCAIGHTAARPDDIRAAVEAGAIMSTHLGNAAAATLPRTDNYIWAQLGEPALAAGLIADGQHLPWFAFRAMLAAKGDENAVLVSDSAALAGATPGRYQTPVGGDVTVEPDGRLAVTGTDYLAGSGATLLDCVRWAHRGAGLDLMRAVELATRRPAQILGLADRGVLRVGQRADIIALDEDLQISQVYVAGAPILSVTNT